MCRTVHRNRGIGGIPDGEAVQGCEMRNLINSANYATCYEKEGGNAKHVAKLHQISAPLGRRTAQDAGADVENNKGEYYWAHHQVSGCGERRDDRTRRGTFES